MRNNQHVSQVRKVAYKESSVQKKGKSPVRSSKERSDADNKMRGRSSTTALVREVHPSKTRFASFGLYTRSSRKREKSSGRAPVRTHRCRVCYSNNNNKFVVYLSMICNAWSEGPSSMPTSPSGNNVNNTIKITQVWLLITF